MHPPPPPPWPTGLHVIVKPANNRLGHASVTITVFHNTTEIWLAYRYYELATDSSVHTHIIEPLNLWSSSISHYQYKFLLVT